MGLKIDYTELPIEDFRGKLFESEEVVFFSYVDAYGHLNSAKYLEMVLNHRVHALEKSIQCFTMDLLKVTGIGLVIANSNVNYIKPSFQSEALSIQSWVNEIQEASFVVEFQILEKKSKQLRANGSLKCVSVDLRTHKTCPLPKFMPSRGNKEDLLNLPNKGK
jgi:YbgC/YbaW family acyl-CoA thioester hydrolase